MYFELIEIDNLGPIEHFRHEFQRDDDGKPRPLVIVGGNGAGKSIVLSQLVNALLAAQGEIYSDPEVDSGKVYKLRSSSYILRGKDYYFSSVKLSGNFRVEELQTRIKKSEFENILKYTPLNNIWNKLTDRTNSVFDSNFSENSDIFRDAFSKSVCAYFPPNRFEEPAWLNETNLKNRVNYSRTSNIAGEFGRNIINYSPLRDNQDWLLDIIFDANAIERRQIIVHSPGQQPQQLQVGDGPASRLLESVAQLLRLLFQKEGQVMFELGYRGRRDITVRIGGEVVASNLFSLSTGQTLVLDIFITIIRQADLARISFSSLEDIAGIIVIDEVDLHLHADLQHRVIPHLVSLFPKVQFVITTHSPLFLMGMKNALGEDNFDIIQLPTGERLSTERFSEFEAAYLFFKESAAFKTDVLAAVAESKMPLVFVEGTTDIDYIRKAAEHLEKQDLLDRIQLQDGYGAGSLGKVFRHFDTSLAWATPQKILLLFDGETSRQNAKKGKLYIRKLPLLQNTISKGSENLFPDALITRAKENNPAFVDITPSVTKIVGGIEVVDEEKWEVNEDQKRNLCDWVCANGNKQDFEAFQFAFDIIEDVLND